ncbi:putative tail-length tape measure protein [Xanthomonas virus PB119]|nr:putative tail-length tape measure protein [Xanthomonas virus PB119]
MSDSIEVLLARLEERGKVQAERTEQILQQLKDQGVRLVSVEQRTANVETSLTTQKPVIDDFITIKHKVVGAGQFGKWVWVIATATVTFILTSREKIALWLTGQ